MTTRLWGRGALFLRSHHPWTAPQVRSNTFRSWRFQSLIFSDGALKPADQGSRRCRQGRARTPASWLACTARHSEAQVSAHAAWRFERADRLLRLLQLLGLRLDRLLELLDLVLELALLAKVSAPRDPTRDGEQLGRQKLRRQKCDGGRSCDGTRAAQSAHQAAGTAHAQRREGRMPSSRHGNEQKRE